MKFTYRPRGVCSQLMEIETEDGKVKSFSVMVIEGMEVEEVIRRLEGVRCGRKATSCPDQLAKALRLSLEQAE